MEKFVLPALPYAYDALEPYIDAKTMEIHHQKHHATYVANLNKALESVPSWADSHTTLDAILKDLSSAPENVKTALRNNAGGHHNHSLFWTILTPKSESAPSSLNFAIEKKFGSLDQCTTLFSDQALARFGSGWVWLALGKDGELEIFSTPNQDSPLMEGKIPMLGLDVWEHAYYLKYQNRRVEYIKAFWNIVNWKEVGKRYDEAK